MTHAGDPPIPPPLALSDLIGAWTLVRHVAFRRGGGNGSFRGRAVVTAAGPDVARYDEWGRLEIAGRSWRASRRYWIRRDEAGALVFYFDDGGESFDHRAARLFVRLAPDPAGSLTGSHRCGADRYEGTYRRRGRRALAITWRVSGPRKEGTIATRLIRETPR